MVRNGGACYTGSVSREYSLEGAVADEVQVMEATSGYGGFWG